MRRWVFACAVAAALVFPIASQADDVAGEGVADEIETDAEVGDEEPEEELAEDEEEEEPTAWDEYLASVVERALTGANGLATSPADPPMATVDPPKALDKAGFMRRPLGFASGILLMGYRAFMGVVDFGLALVPEMPVVSPVPRYKLIPGFEHEDE